LKQAEEAAQTALSLSRALGERYLMASALRHLADVKNATGGPPQSLPLYQQASVLFKESGAQAEEALALNEVGFAFYQLGATQEALNHLTRAWAIQHLINDARAEAVTLNDLGVVCFALG